MKHIDALKKDCPFMSHKATMYATTSNMNGILSNIATFTVPVRCTGAQCMAWVSTTIFDETNPEGYCSLMKQQKISIH